MNEREEVCRTLLENARKVSRQQQKKIELWHPIKADGKDFIPGYIPYVGTGYFDPGVSGRRILAYALSQNLTEIAPYSREWARDWIEGNGELALDRQNRTHLEKGIAAAMAPFDTGHVPVLASLLRSHVSGRPPRPDESIYPEIAATNLSKFSFRSSDRRQSIDKEPCLRQSWTWFSCLEVELLRPDFILCCGALVHRIVGEGMCTRSDAESARPRLLKVSFPGLRVINRYYRRRNLGKEHLRPPQIEQRVSGVDLRTEVSGGQTVRGVIRRDAFYFAEMFLRLVRQLDNETGRC
jgi:hypothetical protein